MNPEVSSPPSLHAGSGNDQVGLPQARDAFQRNSDWWTVFAAFDLPDFNPSPLWISKKTGISVEDVVEALDGLSVLGYLKKANGAFYPTKDGEHHNFSYGDKNKTQVISEHSVVSQQILNDLSEQSLFAFDHCFMTGNKQILTELYHDVQKAFDSAIQKAKQDKKSNDCIFKMTFTAVDVVKPISTEKGARA